MSCNETVNKRLSESQAAYSINTFIHEMMGLLISGIEPSVRLGLGDDLNTVKRAVDKLQTKLIDRMKP